eukprot:COSAG06_NODE_1224_length_10198_cov_15.139816_1_plen_149_part_00
MAGPNAQKLLRERGALTIFIEVARPVVVLCVLSVAWRCCVTASALGPRGRVGSEPTSRSAIILLANSRDPSAPRALDLANATVALVVAYIGGLVAAHLIALALQVHVRGVLLLKCSVAGLFGRGCDSVLLAKFFEPVTCPMHAWMGGL